MSALDALAEWPVPEAAAAVVTSDGVVARYGDVGRDFALASVTKLLVARGVQVAVEEGAIYLDQPSGPPDSTVRHLLAHTSGLTMLSEEVIAAPGARRIYSNAGFAVLARSVQEHSDIEFADYLREAVFEPLGMRSTTLPGGAATAGYGATSNVLDLAKFARELLRPTLVSPELHAEATSVQFPGLAGVLPGFGVQRPNDWGLGFEIRSGKSPHWTGAQNAPSTFGHFGQSGTFLWVDSAAELALVVLTNQDFDGWAYPRWPALSDGVLREFGAH